MPANIFGNNVYLNQEPAWHKLGFVSKKPMGAVEAFSVLEGVYYEKRPITIFLNGKKVEVGDYGIVRSPVPHDPNEICLGFVKKNYNIIQPLTICELFDENVKQHVETLGLLGKGDRLFLTWELPGFSVQDDKIKLYGFVCSGYDGRFGSSLYIVSIRVVCGNTFAMAVQEGETVKSEDGRGKVWSTRHNSHNQEKELGIWLEHVQEKALAKSQTASAIFNEMVGKKIEEKEDLYSLLFNIYPNPKKLPVDFPEKLRAEKQAKIDELMEDAKTNRDGVEKLFNGGGIAITPTVFGLFNCVTQHENYRPTKKPAEYSILFGNRANAMSRAFNVLYDYTKGG